VDDPRSPLYADNEMTAEDEAEEDRIIEEAQARAAMHRKPRQWSGAVDLVLTNGVWTQGT
jgi:hypothetical protein